MLGFTKCFLGAEVLFNTGTVKFNIVDNTYTDLSAGFQLDLQWNSVSSPEKTYGLALQRNKMEIKDLTLSY